MAVHVWRSRRLARVGIACWLCLAAAVLPVAAHAAPVHPGPDQNQAQGASAQGIRTRGLASVQLAGDLNRELLRQLNAVRLRAGLPALRRSRDLTQAAVAHSRSMAKHGYFSHTSYNGSLFWQRVEEYYRAPQGVRAYRVGENLISGPAGVSAATVIR
ncbi:MAG TPA: CAP domain-containing protein, partial [Gaiellaceae bacterium]|nr:CAP domain-containing protein [Gaiellaceae bacterium]